MTVSKDRLFQLAFEIFSCYSKLPEMCTDQEQFCLIG